MTVTNQVDKSFIIPHGKLLEGVTYDGRIDTLYYINIPCGEVYVLPNVSDLTAQPQVPKSYKVGNSVGVIGLTTDVNKLVCGVQKGVVVLDLTSGNVTTLSEYPNNNIVGDRQLRSNDGSVAPDGSFWVGTMVESGDIAQLGSMYKVSGKSGEIIKLWDGCKIPNGINWDSSRKIMYWTESNEHKVYKFNYDLSTSLPDMSSKVVKFEHTGEPDGSCLDAFGNLYIAIWGAGKVVRVVPSSEKLDQAVVDMEWVFPCPNITCVTFGGPNLDQMFVTSANGDSENNTDAAVFRIDVSSYGIKGVAKNLFQL